MKKMKTINQFKIIKAKLKSVFTFYLCSFLIFNFSFLIGTAQNPGIKRTYHWYFGGQAGIDFSSGTAVADTNGKMNVYSGCSVISDTAGNLLFYTDGATVWNSNHDTMPNGTLLPAGTPYQSSVIVPKPQDKNIYYIFHVDGTDGPLGTQGGLKYSVVDMNADSGLGDVTPTKNVLLFKPNTEQLAAVHHANKCDVWVMAHEWHTNNYHAFLVTAAGVDTIPVTQVIGNQIPDSSLINYYFLGGLGLRFTNDGKKMASTMFWDNYNNPALFDTLELYDFDNATALLSNRITIPDSTIGGCFGFSPDGTKLYIGNGTLDAQAYQYDISSNNQSIILSTKTLLYSDTYWNYMDFQNTPDGKIFITRGWKDDSLAVINNPNASGTSCNLVNNGFSLNGRTPYTTLPNFIHSYFGADTTGNCPTTGIQEISQSDKNDCIHIYPNPFSTVANVEITCESHGSSRNKFSIYDVLGSEVSKSEILNQKSEIKRDNLPAGIYFLKILYDNKFFTHKLLIVN